MSLIWPYGADFHVIAENTKAPIHTVSVQQSEIGSEGHETANSGS